MKDRARNRIAIVLVAGGLIVAAPAAAFAAGTNGASGPSPKGTTSRAACSPGDLSAAQQTVAGKLSERSTTLTALMTDVSRATRLTDADRAALQGDIATATTGI